MNIALIVAGIVAIIALGNSAAVWLFIRNGGVISDYAALILSLCVITPLLSAAAAYGASGYYRRRQEKLKYIPFDLNDLFTNCRAFIAPKAAEKGILLHFYGEPAISKMPLGDPERLLQALTHLLSNAVKYTNTGMVKLHSAVQSEREKTITLSFEVKDSGVGMTGDQIEQLLTAQKYGTKDIVKSMGGKLRVESMPGIGSKFGFDLTFDTVDTADADNSTEERPLDEFEKPSFEGEVLLCEDSVINRQVICEHLARVGLRTAVAENGKIGVNMVEARIKKGENLFDLILMDIHMPVMDGMEAASKILALNTGIPIVAITANIMPIDLEIYKMSGMYDYMKKPFTTQELWRTLIKYCRPGRRKLSAELHYMQVTKKMRYKLAAHFVRDHRDTIAEINNAIKAGDIKLAHRLAHTLKGNAGQLEKFLLQQAAQEVEQHLKDEKNRVTPQQMATLETELNAALAELASLAEGGGVLDA